MRRVPVEPPLSPWEMPSPLDAEGDLVATGADLEPGTILAAYRSGLFPMPIDDHRGRSRLAWWSPEPRGILPLDGLRVSRSLRASMRRFEVRVDTSFSEVIAACGDKSRRGRWITKDIKRAYLRLHELGWAHSVESFSLDDGTLAGGLYGIAIGGLFAGESMFHRATDASKVALVHLVEILRSDDRLLDVQWQTPHLESLGVIEVPRREYLWRLEQALSLPLPAAFAS